MMDVDHTLPDLVCQHAVAPLLGLHLVLVLGAAGGANQQQINIFFISTNIFVLIFLVPSILSVERSRSNIGHDFYLSNLYRPVIRF